MRGTAPEPSEGPCAMSRTNLEVSGLDPGVLADNPLVLRPRDSPLRGASTVCFHACGIAVFRNVVETLSMSYDPSLFRARATWRQSSCRPACGPWT